MRLHIGNAKASMTPEDLDPNPTLEPLEPAWICPLWAAAVTI
ncbi:MAG TPA: hypothetical protein VG146_15975 [Verrucomicrobiae bacterium]|nr:hypothetical protein [Verrucomicrobiae bacterium]